MVKLLKFTDKEFFDKSVEVTTISNSFFEDIDEVINFKWFLDRGDCEKSEVFFKINPELNHFSYPKRVNLEEEDVFILSVNTKSLPSSWKGELLIKCGGVVNKIPIFFEKTKILH